MDAGCTVRAGTTQHSEVEMADVELTVPAPNEEAEEEAKKIARDERETFSKITKEQPRDEKAQKDFVAAKVQMALGSSQSYVRNDNQGFRVRFLDANYAYVVTS